MDRNEMFANQSKGAVIGHTVAITIVCALAGMVASKGAEQGYLRGLGAIRQFRANHESES